MSSTCARCTFAFPRLATGTNCAKCVALKPGLSRADTLAINTKPQCVGCGLLSDSLRHPICNFCIKHYRESGQVHASISELPGVRDALNDGVFVPIGPVRENLAPNNISSAAIVESARFHQTQASGSRLAHAPAFKYPGLAGLKSNRNLDIANRVITERKIKAEEAKLLDNGIKITAYLYESWKNRLQLIKGIQTIEVFDGNTVTQTALDKLLSNIRSSFQKVNAAAQEITWWHVTVAAQESQTKFSDLGHVDFTIPLSQFFKAEFVKKKIGTKRRLDNREIDIRFTYNRDTVFIDSSEDEESYGDNDSLEVTSFKRKRSRAFVANSRVSKKPQPSRTLTSSRSTGAISLRSAYKPRSFDLLDHSPHGKRVVETSSFQFIRTNVTYCMDTCQAEVATQESIKETILIANKWQNKDDPGYCGTGSTKRAIYAVFNGKEYVITQPIEGTEYDVRHVLEEEYKLLCQCDGIKSAFDGYVQERGASIPNFYFNFPSSILGELVAPEPGTVRGDILPYKYFIATPLLPFGSSHPEVRKFTGNSDIGDADDDITKAIHAFAHFSVMYSKRHLLLCDLQGSPDRNGTMCLIDPQCHTSTDPKFTVYWDMGKRAIDSFVMEHGKACRSNWVCRQLKLANLVVEDMSPRKTNAKGTKDKGKSKRKGSLSYINNLND